MTRASRLVSPPTLAAATIVAGATTAAAASRLPTGGSEMAQATHPASQAHPGAAPLAPAHQAPQDRASQAKSAPGPVRQGSARAAEARAQRASRSQPRAAIGAPSVRAQVARLLVPATIPQNLTQARPVDSAATRAARAQLAISHATYTRTRAALVAADEAARKADEAWADARDDQLGAPGLEAARTQVAEAARAALRGGTAGGAAALVRPLVRDQQVTSEAYQRRLAAEQALRKAADAHQESLARLGKLRDRTVELDRADTARALAEGSYVQLADGRLGPTVKPGTPVPGNGHVVTPQVSRWIAEALDELYRSGMPQGSRDAEDLAIVIFNESGGDPGTVNLWDTNAAAGMPSFGLMQTIGPTFDAHRLPTRTDRADPIAQICAGARYGHARYGSLSDIPGVKSLRGGGPYRPY